MPRSPFLLLVGFLVLCCSGLDAAGLAKSPVPKKTPPPAAVKPANRHLTIAEAEAKGVFKEMEALMYRMCIREVPFFLALHRCYFLDSRLDKKDTFTLGKRVIQGMLSQAAARTGENELNASPATNIDSMVIFRSFAKKVRPGTCNIIVYARPDAYDIPKTGAKIRVPAKIKGTVVYNQKTGHLMVTIFTKGVKLELPGYAKVLSLGMITDMDIRFAELLSSGNGYEARLLYATGDKAVSKKGWSLNVTECKKIRPYQR